MSAQLKLTPAPAEAPSQSVIAEALELRRLIKSILNSDAPAALGAAMPEVPDRQPAESATAANHEDAFDKLLGRLMDIVSHLQCADGVLYDLKGVPEELQPACIVLHDATQALDTLYNELDSWHVHHICRPKTDEDREAAAAPYEAAMTPEERERYRTSMELPAERKCHPNDHTGNRLRAYVASVRPLRGVVYPDAVESDIQRGRSLIERLALSAEGIDLPQLKLTAAQVADVLSFVASSEPVEPQSWWEDPPNGPSHLVGFYLLLEALEESLRAAPVAQNTTPQRSEADAELAKVTGTSELPQGLLDHLSEQQGSVNELLSFLTRLDESDDTPMCLRMGVRLAGNIAEALDPLTLGKVLKAEESQP